jgi:outer membrane protein assembly factor BamB
VHRANCHAASTPCVDAAGVFVYFGSYGLLCYDHEGRERWKKPIPTPQSLYGMATSPIRYGNLVVLVADDDANLPGSRLSRSKVIALNDTNGAVVWETPRPYNRSGWSTPMIWQHGNGTDLVVFGNGRVYGYDPGTGQERWYANGFSRETISSPVAGNGHLYVSASMRGGFGDDEFDPEPFWLAMLQFDVNGDKRIGREEITEHFTMPIRPELPPGHPGFGIPLSDDPAARKRQQEGIFTWRDKNKDGFWTREEFIEDMSYDRARPNLAAIRPGGEGDVTDTHVSWNLRRGIPEIPSPVFHENRLYIVRDGGIVSSVNAKTGAVVYRERTGARGQYTASPVIAGGHLFLTSARGVITVATTGDAFTIVHQEDFGVPMFATPALDEDSLYVRTEESVMAFRR